MKSLFLILLVAVLTVAGCNTMAGLGKDIERTGEKIQDKARK